MTRELHLNEIVSTTFRIYRRDFAKYVVFFLVAAAVTGIVTPLVQNTIVLPSNATFQQFLVRYLPDAILSWLFTPLTYGSVVKMASDNMEKGERAHLLASVRFALSKSLSIWAVIFVAGIITLLGYIALVVPGIILEIMYSLVLPVIIIEGLGLKSMKRSRELVRHRWLKTLVLYVVLGLILEIPAVIALTIISFTGFPAPIVEDIVMGFVLPIVPISFTVYYYSNLARITFPASSQSLTFPAIQVEPMYFCPHCGQKTISPDSKFCSNCGRVLRT